MPKRNRPPVTNPTAIPTSGNVPLAVQFAANASDPDGSIASYAWTFGDGGTDSTANPSHTYAAVGSYQATVIVTDNRGARASGSVAINVTQPQQGGGQTFYVSTTGNDANPGTQALPKRTIRSGVSLMTAGQPDTLIISGGVYTEGNIGYDGGGGFPLRSGQDANNYATIRAADGETVIIRPPSSFTRVVVFAPNEIEVIPHCQYIEFRDLEFDGSNVTSDTVKVTISAATTQPHHIRFRNCNIHQGTAPHHAQGVLISNGNNIEVIGGKVHDNGTDGQDHQVYISHTSNNTVDSVELYNSHGHGVQVWSDPAPAVQATNNTIRNCVAHNCSRGFGVYCGNGNIIYNSIAYSNVDGIYFRNDGGTLDAPQAYNNVCYANSSTGITIASVNASALIKNNIAYLNGININDQANSVMTANVTTDPQFVNAAAHDFHLVADSVAIDAGVDLSAIFVTDKDGASRPQGAAWDIGAYER